jgi:hypothetical protein
MARLYSDLQSSGGSRYYFGLNSAPGGVSNFAPAGLVIVGYAPVIQEQLTAFRTPATATLTLNGRLASAEPHLQPATAAIGFEGRAPGLLTLQVITNALPPDYTNLPDNAPTILFIQTISPARALLTIQSLEHNITQGGNIGYISPGVATLTLAGYSPNFPRFADVGSITVNGRAATLLTTLNISPEPAALSFVGRAPLLTLPFVWIDDDPVTPVTWIDEPRV